jgi:hypothetical protein
VLAPASPKSWWAVDDRVSRRFDDATIAVGRADKRKLGVASTADYGSMEWSRSAGSVFSVQNDEGQRAVMSAEIDGANEQGSRLGNTFLRRRAVICSSSGISGADANVLAHTQIP